MTTDAPIRQGDTRPGHVVVVFIQDAKGALIPHSAQDLDLPFLGVFAPEDAFVEVMTDIEFGHRCPGLQAR